MKEIFRFMAHRLHKKVDQSDKRPVFMGESIFDIRKKVLDGHVSKYPLSYKITHKVKTFKYSERIVASLDLPTMSLQDFGRKASEKETLSMLAGRVVCHGGLAIERLSAMPALFCLLILLSVLSLETVSAQQGGSGDFLKKNAADTSKGSSSTDMLRIENTGPGRGMTVISSGAHGVYATSSSNQAGLEGENSGSGAGVRGSSQSHHGTIGFTSAGDKAGIFGNSKNGIGVWGHSASNHAVFGQSANGRGVKGVSPAGGVFGESTQGLGVEGRSNANDGVVGWTNSPQKSGVFGYSPNGIGVTGRSESTDGILGVSTSNDPFHAAIRARNEGAGLAIISEGNVLVAGRTTTQVLEITGGADLSELFDVRGLTDEDMSPSSGQVKPGMLVSIDSDNPGKLVVSNKAYDQAVAGIISGAGGVKPGLLMGQKDSQADGSYSVALTGRVYGWVDAANGPIKPGDLLTTSPITGYGMKVDDYEQARGAIIGKAMTSLPEGSGLVLVLLALQ